MLFLRENLLWVLLLCLAVHGTLRPVDALRALWLPRARKRQIREALACLVTASGAAGRPFHWDMGLHWRIKRRHRIEESAQALTAAILEHMGCSPRAIRLHVVHSAFSSFEHRRFHAGRYHSGAGEIELILKKEHSFWNVGAILSHECAHYYLDRHRLHPEAGVDAEEFTDLAAVALGFGRLLRKGYREITRSTLFQVKSARIGYLSVPEIIYSCWVCLGLKGHAAGKAANEGYGAPCGEIRPPGAREAPREGKGADLRRPEELWKETDARYRRLLELTEAARHSSGATTPDDLGTLQEIYHAVQSRSLEETLQTVHGRLDADCADKELGELTARLKRWEQLLQAQLEKAAEHT